MICPHCNAENREGAKYCDECGTRLTPATVELPAIDPEPSPDEEAEERAIENAGTSGDDTRDELLSALPDVEAPFEADLDEDASEADASGDADDVDTQEGETDAPLPADETGVIETREDAPVSESSKTRPIDLSGFDEYLPKGTYSAPEPSWRDGGTMRMPRIEEESSINDQKSFRAPEKKKRGSGVKIALAVILVLALCGAGAAFATYQMELWGGKVVPDVVGMTQADATNTLQSKGFAVRATQVKSDETEGVVLLMDPGKGGRMQEGGEVVIHVATARQVPAITGMARAEAEAALSAEGLDNVTITTQRSDEAEGTVLSVDPAEGQKVRANTAVTVVVAEPYTVPSIANMTQSQATTALQEAGYNPYIEYVYTEEYVEGTVLGTNPGEGERLPSGSDVGIRVAMSRANELVSATQYLLAPGATVVIDGINYDIVSCDSVTYQGNETTAYTITATPFTYFLGVKLPLSAQAVSGSITWTADNTIASSSPSLSIG
ncbi:MAG TPA: PASTA domain-containing protein [Candidatus Aphodovivens avicola]|nr:PASTA domain-containing protein [Candidatus Aphodovivens avicola]